MSERDAILNRAKKACNNERDSQDPDLLVMLSKVGCFVRSDLLRRFSSAVTNRHPLDQMHQAGFCDHKVSTIVDPTFGQTHHSVKPNIPLNSGPFHLGF